VKPPAVLQKLSALVRSKACLAWQHFLETWKVWVVLELTLRLVLWV
jgi:hypothetical protein